jgi:hypothetical protein
MFAFHFLNYKITVDPIYAFQLLNHMWATEPVGTLSICITVTGILLTLSFKLFDIVWDIFKERSRSGRLRIELSAAQNMHGQAALLVVVSNVGKEPVVVRDIGYARHRLLLGREFIPIHTPDAKFPHALNARDLVQVTVPDELDELVKIAERFQVKDSLGKIWDTPDSEIRKVKRQLRMLESAQVRAEIISQLQSDPSMPSQN